MSFRLAVSAEMVFVDLPFLERVRRIADAGFEVEIWDWTRKDVDALARTGATFSSMTGYITGTLADPDGAEELLRTAEESLKVAEQLDCPRLNVHGTGLDPQGLPVLPTEVVTPAMWLQAVTTLSRLAELGQRAGRVFTLENLNTAVDHPGTPFAKAADTLALVEAVDSPHLTLNLDLYHAQIGEGNLVQLVERALASIGEIHRRRSGALRAGHRGDPLPGGGGGAGPPRLRRCRGPRGLGVGRPRAGSGAVPVGVHGPA
jgi:hydroxypyruvate isomerase